MAIHRVVADLHASVAIGATAGGVALNDGVLSLHMQRRETTHPWPRPPQEGDRCMVPDVACGRLSFRASLAAAWMYMYVLPSDAASNLLLAS